jgi:rubrerythrin
METTAKLQRWLTQTFLRKVTSTARGRSMALALCAEAESNGEGQVFDRALAKVDDPELQKVIRRHAEDEVEHARLFAECCERQGLPVPPIPPELKIIDRLDRALNNLLERPIEDDMGVLRAYLLLQVVEERAMYQFGLMEPVFREVDPQSADVMLRIARDEGRHLKYCQAIARRYAPDVATHMAELKHMREVEARVFREQNRVNLAFFLDSGTVKANAIERQVWTAAVGFSSSIDTAGRTPYWDEMPRSVEPTLQPQPT